MNSSVRLLVVSPHLDDAVLSCGLFLAGHSNAVVCTIFTAPPEANMTTDWDRDSGFTDAFEAMRARKSEDARALSTLGASPIHLPFCDAQYLSSPSHAALVAALKKTFVELEPATLLMPLGLFHSDHVMVADACLASMRSFENMSVLAYEDVPYRKIPGILQDRLSVLLERGFIADPADITSVKTDARHHQLKQTAINSYQSQLRAFGPDAQASLDSPERYWRLLDIAGHDTARAQDDGHNACSMPLPPLRRISTGCRAPRWSAIGPGACVRVSRVGVP
ncbi:PIG-L family deacetylase [Paraburkholderia fungorum]|uniref:PIG-L deacetylase family protein n=1 Tax=Paraburkholderia TaxID=1822464 RepID=UPI0038B988CF